MLEHLDILLAAPRHDPIALLLLDLNRFKEVNDTYGHQAGDNLLEQAARRLAAVTRDGDLLARLGGDEFVVVVSGPNVDERAAVAVADRIREALRETFIVEEIDMTIDVSIGVALAHGDSNLLFQQADIAMYHAKRSGGGHAVFDRIPVRPSVAASVNRS
ncbi:GGDEF domain-containing protein [Actinoplanes subglobosus]|uniref:GGDEF domain-containing protein n=1 Tax=Actinoplanes subglobosus TaxID=1547892 RepID=A0ABV8J090_9ACTN